MNKYQKVSLFLLRISLGWLMFYAGITKVLDPSWSALGYLKGAKILTSFYGFLIRPGVLPGINFVNEWGLTLLGVSLILGVGIRFSAVLGSLLMLLYYLPILDFPYPDPHSFIVDNHIIYLLGLLVLASFHAGNIWGLGHIKIKNFSLS